MIKTHYICSACSEPCLCTNSYLVPTLCKWDDNKTAAWKAVTATKIDTTSLEVQLKEIAEKVQRLEEIHAPKPIRKQVETMTGAACDLCEALYTPENKAVIFSTVGGAGAVSVCEKCEEEAASCPFCKTKCITYDNKTFFNSP